MVEGGVTKRLVHLRLDPSVLRRVDIYAAQNDMYRNEAVEDLLSKALEKLEEEQRHQQNKKAAP